MDIWLRLWLDVGQEYGTAGSFFFHHSEMLWLDVGQEYGTAVNLDELEVPVLWLDVGQEYGTAHGTKQRRLCEVVA